MLILQFEEVLFTPVQIFSESFRFSLKLMGLNPGVFFEKQNDFPDLIKPQTDFVVKTPEFLITRATSRHPHVRCSEFAERRVPTSRQQTLHQRGHLFDQGIEFIPTERVISALEGGLLPLSFCTETPTAYCHSSTPNSPYSS